MALVWSNILILVFAAHFVVPQRYKSQCGEPAKYPDKLLHPRYRHKTVFNDQDRVSYICAQGYALTQGSKVSLCDRGRWTPLSMKCQKKKCNALGEIENGQYFRQGQSFGDKAIAVCNKGYALRGEGVRMCTEKGWNGTDPICEGKVSVALLPRSAIPETCPAPNLGKSGTVKEQKSDYVPGESISVTCSEGFMGSGVFTCHANSKWHPKEPKCQLITCSAPTVANGRITSGSKVYKHEDTVDVICNDGFDLIGPAQVTCGADGQWQALPECQPKRTSGKCGPAPSHPQAFPRDDSPMLKEYSSGDRLRYKCSVGYVRTSGSTSIRCENGRWTNLQLQCERKKCGSAGEISYGKFEYTGVSFGDSATASCREGYELIGQNVRICRDGGWDGRNPVCEPVHCPPPPEVKGAEMSDLIYDYVSLGQAVSYRCRTGALIGAREIYCTKSGTWSAPPPECKDIVCPNPHVPGGSRMRGFRAVYKYGNTVTIACNPGLRLVGESFVTCGQDGKWTPNLPECV